MATNFQWTTPAAASMLTSELGSLAGSATANSVQNQLQIYVTQINTLLEKLGSTDPLKNKSGYYRTTEIKNVDAQVLKDAYKTIMELREFLTGQTIQYRVFMDDGNQVSALELNTKQLLETAYKEGNSLRLGDYSALEKIGANVTNTTQGQNMNKRYRQVMEYFDWVPTGRKRYDRKTETYVDIQALKINEEKYKNRLIPGLSSKKRNQQWNRGWLFQAVNEQIIYDPIVEDRGPSLMRKMIDYSFFSKYLKRDTVKGFRGGDIIDTSWQIGKNQSQGQWQIKGVGASIMNQKTMMSYLSLIRDIMGDLNKLKKGIETDMDVNQIKDKVSKYFTTNDGLQNAANQAIDNAINSLLDGSGIKNLPGVTMT